MLSLNITKTDAITPASTAASSEPNKYQATRVTSPPVAAEPISRPSVARIRPPSNSTGMIRNGLSGSMLNEPGLCQCGGSGAGSCSPSIIRIIRLTPAVMPPEIAGLEFRRDVFVDNALGGGVGETAFQAVPDFDTQMTIVLGNDKERAVVDLLAPNLPGFRNPDRILLDGFRRSRQHDQHRDLAAFPGFQRFKGLRQRGDVAARERAGLIDHPPRQRRHCDVGCGRNSPAHPQRK